MKFYISAKSIKIEIVASDGKGILAYTTPEYELEADIKGLVTSMAEVQAAALGAIQAALDAQDKAEEETDADHPNQSAH